MSKVVFDTSVFIAIINNESYDPAVLDLLEGAVMGAVNVAEIWTKLHEFQIAGDPRIGATFALLGPIEPFTAIQARLTGDLRMPTRHLGLSLGDRACLALGLDLDADVYTAEKNWALAQVGCRVHLIR